MNLVIGIRKIMDKGLAWLCSGIFMALVVIGTYQIVVRYLFNSPSTVSEELLTYGFTWLALLAAALVFGQREHMRMGFLADKISGTKRVILEVAIELLILVFVGIVMIYGGVEIVKLTMSQTTASLGIPMGVVYLAVLFSGIMIAVYCVLNIIDLCSHHNHEIWNHSFGEKQLHDKELSDEEVLLSQEILEETEEP